MAVNNDQNLNFITKLIGEIGNNTGKKADKIEEIKSDDVKNIFASADLDNDGVTTFEEFMKASADAFDLSINDMKVGDYKKLIEEFGDEYDGFASDFEINTTSQATAAKDPLGEAELEIKDGDGNVTGIINIRDDIVEGSEVTVNPDGSYTIKFGTPGSNPLPGDVPVGDVPEEEEPVTDKVPEGEEETPATGEEEPENVPDNVDYSYTTPDGKEISVNVPDGWIDMEENDDQLTFIYSDGSKRTVGITTSGSTGKTEDVPETEEVPDTEEVPGGVETQELKDDIDTEANDNVDYVYTDPEGKEISVNVPDGWIDMEENDDQLTFIYSDGYKRTVGITKPEGKEAKGVQDEAEPSTSRFSEEYINDIKNETLARMDKAGNGDGKVDIGEAFENLHIGSLLSGQNKEDAAKISEAAKDLPNVLMKYAGDDANFSAEEWAEFINGDEWGAVLDAWHSSGKNAELEMNWIDGAHITDGKVTKGEVKVGISKDLANNKAEYGIEIPSDSENIEKIVDKYAGEDGVFTLEEYQQMKNDPQYKEFIEKNNVVPWFTDNQND